MLVLWSIWCVFDLESKEITVKQIEHESQLESFWKDTKEAKRKQKLFDLAKKDLSICYYLKNLIKDIEAGIEILSEQEDVDLEQEIECKIKELKNRLNELEFVRMFSGPYDTNNAIITIQSGAGGTESQDWVQKLFRMYSRWAEKKNYKFDLMNLQYGEIAGIKTITFRIDGEYAYGMLKSENGVHRFMRISPFDANKKRHTSFARIDLIPVLEDEVEIKIDKLDLKIDIYKASGPGGQHRNKVETAVRITHLPTGIVVRSERSRSQNDNKETAMSMLKNKLVFKMIEDKKKKIEEIVGEKDDINFGHQIRTYVLYDKQSVIDERSGKEYRPVEDILDGDLDVIMTDYLKSNYKD